jgi:starvation-inducible DNA-binding protein
MSQKKGSGRMSKQENGRVASGGSVVRKAEMEGEILRKLGDIEPNAVGLPEKAAKDLVGALDTHLAAYNVLYHQYHKHHWLVSGPQFRDLHVFFEEHYQQVHEHLDAVAERLTLLGGIPTCSPVEQEKLSYIRHEPEGLFRIREMLRLDLECERQVCIQLRRTIGRAAELEDYGTKRLLEGLLAAAEDRAHHVEHFLEPDSLEIGLTASESDLDEN